MYSSPNIGDHDLMNVGVVGFREQQDMSVSTITIITKTFHDKILFANHLKNIFSQRIWLFCEHMQILSVHKVIKKVFCHKL